jgi:hypothetical protein
VSFARDIAPAVPDVSLVLTFTRSRCVGRASGTLVSTRNIGLDTLCPANFVRDRCLLF